MTLRSVTPTGSRNTKSDITLYPVSINLSAPARGHIAPTAPMNQRTRSCSRGPTRARTGDQHRGTAARMRESRRHPDVSARGTEEPPPNPRTLVARPTTHPAKRLTETRPTPHGTRPAATRDAVGSSRNIGALGGMSSQGLPERLMTLRSRTPYMTRTTAESLCCASGHAVCQAAPAQGTACMTAPVASCSPLEEGGRQKGQAHGRHCQWNRRCNSQLHCLKGKPRR